MYTEILVEAKIANPNRKHYEPLLGRTLKVGEVIKVKQKDLTPTSRVEVLCECELCNKQFYRMRKDVKDNTYCSTDCRNEFLKTVNPNKDKEKFIVNCDICKKEFGVHESKFKKQDVFLCSRECYKLHRSQNYNGDKIYNYQDINVTCSNYTCQNEVKLCKYDEDNRVNHFCSQECYWQHRRDNYTELYFVPQLFENRRETEPERKVREWLNNNDIAYIQEHPIDNYFVDFYLTEYNQVIEVFGDYWHVNPSVYGEGKRKLHKNQLGKQEQDKQRIIDIESNNLKVHVIWEKEVKENLDYYMGMIIQKIFNKNPQRLHANPLSNIG